MNPSLSVAKRFLAEHPPPGRVLMCAITGSHQYGFPSVDSDIDIKGIHQAPTREFLGLSRPREAHDRLEMFDGIECDLTTHEVGKALALLLKGNGNILERLTSPFQLVEGPVLDALRERIPDALSTAVYGHYSGYFRGMQREHEREPRAKSLLYSYRVALTGVHLLRTGKVEAHLPTLADTYSWPELHPLIALKHQAEKVKLSQAESAPYVEGWTRLEAMLVNAREHSVLPAAPSDPGRLEGWLIDARRSTRS